VVIPDRSQWTNNPNGQASFECRIPSWTLGVQAQGWWYYVWLCSKQV
jgi:hypothetical protein